MNFFNDFFTSSKFNELRRRLLFLFLAMIIYRIGSNIPVPGIDLAKLGNMFSESNGIFGLFNLFSGGALSRLTIFALGIMPYISASIIIQLLSVTWKPIKKLKKDGYYGRNKMFQYIRYLTLFLAIFQSFGMLKFISVSIVNHSYFVYISIISSLVVGTLFLMWLGEQISEKGIGNGISLIIFFGIIVNIPRAIFNTFDKVKHGDMHFISLIVLLISMVMIICFIVFVERGQRRIVVNYAKKQYGGKLYAAQQTYLPLKINIAGVLPPIFASSFILFPATIIQWLDFYFNIDILKRIVSMFSPGEPVYIVIYACATMFFCFFYTFLIFNFKETAENLKKSGGFLIGIRPGDQTSKYIKSVVKRLTLIGSLYIMLVCVLPEFLILFMNVPFYFGGTSLLIVVVVVMDFVSHLQTYLMSYQYDSLLKKNRKIR